MPERKKERKRELMNAQTVAQKLSTLLGVELNPRAVGQLMVDPLPSQLAKQRLRAIKRQELEKAFHTQFTFRNNRNPAISGVTLHAAEFTPKKKMNPALNYSAVREDNTVKGGWRNFLLLVDQFHGAWVVFDFANSEFLGGIFQSDFDARFAAECIATGEDPEALKARWDTEADQFSSVE